MRSRGKHDAHVPEITNFHAGAQVSFPSTPEAAYGGLWHWESTHTHSHQTKKVAAYGKPGSSQLVSSKCNLHSGKLHSAIDNLPSNGSLQQHRPKLQVFLPAAYPSSKTVLTFRCFYWQLHQQQHFPTFRCFCQQLAPAGLGFSWQASLHCGIPAAPQEARPPGVQLRVGRGICDGGQGAERLGGLVPLA
eukprot:1133966-Pelagomonas_calceolata.AAC.4